MFNKIEELIEDIKQGKMVILIDDEDRENEGDIVCAAEHITPEQINFMAKEARGLICLALDKEQIERLDLPLMVKDEENYSPNKTAFTVSIEASQGVSTGISAADRAHTIRVASHRNAKPSDVRCPGHVFPIRAQAGGVLKRAGHTEGSVDLARLAGLTPAAVICEVMNDDGSMARVPDLKKFAQKHKLKIGTIVELIEYRLAHETLVEEVFSAQLPDSFGENLMVRVFSSRVEGQEHLVLQKGEIKKDSPVLVRVHVENSTKDLLSALQRGETALNKVMRIIESSQAGVLLLLRGAGKNTSLVGELKAITQTQPEEQRPPFLMDSRDYGIGAQILRAMGIQQVRLLSNHIEKKVGIKAFGLEIIEVVPLNELGEINEEVENRSGYSSLQ